MQLRLSEVSGFDLLFQMIKEAIDPIPGIGELTVYDTALRIAAKLGERYLPNRVYIHAGTRQGAIALGLDPRAESIARLDFPPELQLLVPFELEDCLCMFADELDLINQ